MEMDICAIQKMALFLIRISSQSINNTIAAKSNMPVPKVYAQPMTLGSEFFLISQNMTKSK